MNAPDDSTGTELEYRPCEWCEGVDSWSCPECKGEPFPYAPEARDE